jgi:hypothetical protein
MAVPDLGDCRIQNIAEESWPWLCFLEGHFQEARSNVNLLVRTVCQSTGTRLLRTFHLKRSQPLRDDLVI